MSDDFQQRLPSNSDPERATSSDWGGWLDLLLLPFHFLGLIVRAVAGAIAAVFQAS